MSLDLVSLKAKFLRGETYDLDRVIRHAYKDVQLRTIKGHSPGIQEECIAYLKEQFENIIVRQPLSDADFESAHKEICEKFVEIINFYPDIVSKQSFGKGQKVVNIIFKFLVAYGIWKNEAQCHMPVDSFVLKWLYGKETYNGTSWSNLSYDEYVQVQACILDKIKKPISVGNKTDIVVQNRAQADYYVWYITKVERNYKDTKNIIKKMVRNMDADDITCVKKADVDRIVDELEKLKQKIQELWK